jgi:hypothetical protein
LAKKVEEIKGKKLTIVAVDKPLSRWSTWTQYDVDLQKFLDSDMKYGRIDVPEGVDAMKLRAGLRSRIKAKFKDEIKLVSRTDTSGRMQLQLQKVKK